MRTAERIHALGKPIQQLPDFPFRQVIVSFHRRFAGTHNQFIHHRGILMQMHFIFLNIHQISGKSICIGQSHIGRNSPNDKSIAAEILNGIADSPKDVHPFPFPEIHIAGYVQQNRCQNILRQVSMAMAQPASQEGIKKTFGSHWEMSTTRKPSTNNVINRVRSPFKVV